MRIALVNGSPKSGRSASEGILNSLKNLLPEGDGIEEMHLRTHHMGEEELERLAGCDALVFAFPLYVDGVPSQLLSCMVKMEAFFKERSVNGIMVYAMVNSGFYEGKQNENAIDHVKNWALKSNLSWGTGLGIGGGGMLASTTNVPDGQGPKKNYGEAMKVLAGRIVAGETGESLFISPNFPRFAYKLGAEMGWRQQIKANGMKRKDLDKRILSLTR
ncbi:MAG TPA: hypothetical protein VLN47_07025 [Clostridiaceae bacterium]|nr:hypothetical protein [Clostridiaceae bacterium]